MIDKKSVAGCSTVAVLSVLNGLSFQAYYSRVFHEAYKSAQEIAKQKAINGEPADLYTSNYRRQIDTSVSGGVGFGLGIIMFVCLGSAFELSKRLGERGERPYLFLSIFCLGMFAFLQSLFPRGVDTEMARQIGSLDGYDLGQCQENCEKYNQDTLVGLGGIDKSISLAGIATIGVFASVFAVGAGYCAGVRNRRNNELTPLLDAELTEKGVTSTPVP